MGVGVGAGRLRYLWVTRDEHYLKEAIWLRCLLTELGQDVGPLTHLFKDNQLALAIV